MNEETYELKGLYDNGEGSLYLEIPLPIWDLVNNTDS